MNRRFLRNASVGLVCAAVTIGLPVAPAGATYNPVASGTTKLTLAKPFLALLKQNGVKLSGSAGVALKAGVVTFPVSGGKFDPTTSNGFVEHAGALLFKAGSRKVPLTSLQLKTTQKHAPFSAKFGGGQLKVASAEKLTVTREGFGDKVEVSTLKLSAKVATRLDKKLHLKGVFEAGQPIGTAVTKANPQTVAVAESGMASFVFDPAIAAKLQSLFVAINPVFPAEHPGPLHAADLHRHDLPDARPKGRSRPWAQSNWSRSAAARSSCAKPGLNSAAAPTRPNSSSIPRRPTPASRVGCRSAASASPERRSRRSRRAHDRRSPTPR